MATTERPRTLPIIGLGLDAGLPDGANVSLVVRPLPWIRTQLGLGSNSISRGIRFGLGFLPFRDGPGLVAEYGHYQDGDANGLASKLVGSGFQQTPLLERVGYDYFNLHAALNFGYHRTTFFVQGGLTHVRGHLGKTASTVTGSSTDAGTVQVAVLDNPTFKSTGIAGKLGLIVYIW